MITSILMRATPGQQSGFVIWDRLITVIPVVKNA
jgi:hypothetical protein